MISEKTDKDNFSENQRFNNKIKLHKLFKKVYKPYIRETCLKASQKNGIARILFSLESLCDYVCQADFGILVKETNLPFNQ